MSYASSFIQPKRLLLIAVFFFVSLFLAACGGGGSSDGADTNNDDNINSPPVANAGADVNVNEGDTVPLEATGTDSDGEVVGYSWSQLSDTKVTFTAVDLENGDFTFVAPHTIEPLTLEFSLTVTDDEGATGTDTFLVTIEPVNAAPEVMLGRELHRHDDGISAQIVANAFDTDGTIVAYQWSQLSGPDVELTGADSLVTTIPKQNISEPTEYTFQLTVTDNEGANASGTIDYTLYPASYPHVDLDFPPPGSTLQSATVRLFGSAYAGADTGATIKSVTVTVEESAAISTDVTGTGHAEWSLADLTVPLDEDTIDMVLTVTDSADRSYPYHVSLRTGEQAGGGPALSGVVDVAVPKFAPYKYVLTSGSFLSDIDIVPILFAGHRLDEVSDNSDSDLGPQIDGPVCMIVNKQIDLLEDDILYVGTLNTDAPLVAVNAETGIRTLVTGPGKGEGPNIESVMGMAFGATENDLYVADNVGQAIYHVDLNSGDRTFIADLNTTPTAVMYPLDVAYDATNHRLYASQNITDYTSVLSIDLNESPATATVLSDDSNDGPELEPYSHGIHLSHDGSDLYFYNATNDQMLEIDLATGDKREIASGITGSNSSYEMDNWKGFDLDSWSDILYVVGSDGGSRDALYAIDAVSGSKVLISR